MTGTCTIRSAVLAAGLLALLIAPATAFALQTEIPEPQPHVTHQEPTPGDAVGPEARVFHVTPCVDGMAGVFPCKNVDLLYQMDLTELGGASRANDIWGWTDPLTGNEYALIGLRDGTAFVDVTEPEDPVRLGNLPTQTGESNWRDIKVYADHAFIVSEASGHGLQVFDLTQLRDVVSPPVTFSTTAHHDGFSDAHNIVINEDTGFAYAVGGDTCGGGLHFVDISDPLDPSSAGCFSADGYTHDAQCVIYAGPDTEHVGKEICFNSNEDTLTIVDVTDKNAPSQISRTGYSGVGYTHQGWLTEDHAYFLLDDEQDESFFGHNTRTRIWDLTDLDAPSVLASYFGPVEAIDHNLYTHDGHAYEANYKSGLRILSLAGVADGELTEVAFFDIYPADDDTGFSGAWSVYPYFESGTVIVSGIGEGLFVLRPALCTDPAAPTGLSATPAGDNQIDLAWSGGGAGETFNVYRALGSCPGGSWELIASEVAGNAYSDEAVSGQLEFAYAVSASDPTGVCESPLSGCASATTTGPCTVAPTFAGLEQVVNPSQVGCALDLSWSAGTANCGAGVDYSVYRDVDPEFTPSAANRIATSVGATAYTDTAVDSGTPYAYVVRSTDTGTGVEDENLVVLTGTPTGPASDGTYAFGAEVGDPPVTFDTPAAAGGFLHIGWELSTDRVHSGDRSYFSTYESDSCIAVVSPPIELTAGESSELSFWTVYQIEDNWDGGVVEISSDGGASWATLPIDGGYPGAFNSGSDACGYSEGQPSFTGTDLTWSEVTADLSAWAGSEILLRWTFSSDSVVNEEGWYVDDVAITNAQVPGQCISGGLFIDGFETGDTSAWTTFTP